MKRILLLLGLLALLWGLICPEVSAGIIQGRREGTAPPSCDTNFVSNWGTTESHIQLGYLYTKVATRFTSNKATTVCRADLALAEIGNPGGSGYTFKAAIYTNVSDAPGALIGSWSDSISTDIGTTETAVTFPNMSASINASTDYWIVVEISQTNSSNYIVWKYDSDFKSAWNKGYSGSWATINSRQGKFRLYE